MPAVAFYVSRADLFKRIAQCLALALLILPIVIGISPGGSQSIVYSSASLMNARDQSEAKFLLTEIYAAEDFSSDIWGAVESVGNQPLISAFPLFSLRCFASLPHQADQNQAQGLACRISVLRHYEGWQSHPHAAQARSVKERRLAWKQQVPVKTSHGPRKYSPASPIRPCKTTVSLYYSL